MADPGPELEEVRVHEHPLPGAGRYFELTTSGGTVLEIVRESDTSDSELGVLPPGADQAAVRVRLTHAEAITMSSLLSGVKYVVRSDGGADAADPATPTVVTLRTGSPAIGRLPREVELPEPADARIVAVIRDDTEALLEADEQRHCQVGDRLVVVGRQGSLPGVVRHLLG